MRPSDKDMHEIVLRVKNRMDLIRKNFNERDEDFARRKARHISDIILQVVQEFYNGVSDKVREMYRNVEEYFARHPYI